MKKPIVCVVGSINMDLTVSTKEMPMQGETTIGGEFATYPGGKGANQAVAAARLGANVNMIGAVGKDPFGETLLKHLKSEGVSVSGIHTIPDIATGVATIILTENDNRIIVSSGANRMVTPEVVELYRSLIEESDVLLLQLEIPIETVMYAARLAHACNIPVVVNPAPYQDLPIELVEKVTYLTPNEIEKESMKKHFNTSSNRKTITTRGDSGVQFFEGDEKKYLPSHHVKVIDTTGAGDTFNGALALKLGNGEKVSDAIMFANAAAALSITKVGAQGGMPTMKEVEEFLREEVK
ncbi:ribokinase [Virgibacillus necropolis]|uniref:Ribokinase n=1 Tax=Virgibacillus necropolis TaxID=163877 RepID=A0A221MIJ0_9BACI|nr:ribokinase [Virgibacillus necropolis]ASN07446.1 ribokinase [Virgibacillus necropolis]